MSEMPDCHNLMQRTYPLPSKQRILIVDDVSSNAILVKRMLAQYDCEIAFSGQEALQKLDKIAIDVILLDVIMPDLDGFEVCKQIRNNPNLKNVPIVMVTALDDKQSKLKGLKAGANEFLSKPIDATELTMRVANIVKVKEYGDYLSRYNENLLTITQRQEHTAEALKKARDGLEIEVEKRTQELFAANEELTAMNDEYIAMNEKLQYINLELENEIDERKRIESILRLSEEELVKKNTQLARTLQDSSLAQGSLIQQEKLAGIGRLVAGVAHEINNPLTFIKMNAELLSRMLDRHFAQDPVASMTEAQYKRPVEAVIRGVERIANIVSGLKFFSSQQQREKTSVGLSQCLEEAWVVVSSNKELSNAVDMRITIESDVIIYGNAQQLEQVFINLFHNALKAIHTRRPQQGCISVSIFQYFGEIEWVVIGVTDNGCGITQSTISRIFEPFYTSDRENGTGLGLSIVQGIIKEHGGNIEVMSNLGEGTTFTIRLPAWR